MSDEPSAAPAVTEQTSAAPAENGQSVSETDANLQGTLQGPEGEATAGAPEAETTGEADAGKPKSGNKVPYRERVEQLVQARNAALEENRQLQARIADFEAKSKAAKPVSLDPLEYQTDAEFQEALLAEQARRVAGAVRQELLNEQQQDAQDRAAKAIDNAWGENVARFREAAPDFEQVALNNAVPMRKEVVQLIKQSEVGPEIAYWLGKNIDAANRIFDMPPMQAALEIGRIEARVSAKAAPRFTQAPPPVKTVGSGLGAGAKSLHDMSYKEFEAAQLAKLQGKN